MDPSTLVNDAIAKLAPQIPALRRGTGSPAANALFAVISKALRARGEGAVFDTFVNNPSSSDTIKAVLRQAVREDPAFAHELRALANNAIPSRQTVQIGNTARGDIAGGDIDKSRKSSGGLIVAIVVIAIVSVIYLVVKGMSGGSEPLTTNHGGGDPFYDPGPISSNVVANVPGNNDVPSNFDIQGSWKSVGQQGWGQAQPGAIVQFANGRANLYSPSDTYAFYKSGNGYLLDVTGMLGGTSQFAVTILDVNNIELYQGGDSEPTVVLKRVG